MVFLQQNWSKLGQCACSRSVPRALSLTAQSWPNILNPRQEPKLGTTRLRGPVDLHWHARVFAIAPAAPCAFHRRSSTTGPRCFARPGTLTPERATLVRASARLVDGRQAPRASESSQPCFDEHLLRLHEGGVGRGRRAATVSLRRPVRAALVGRRVVGGR